MGFINGWTKEKVIAAIMAGNKGVCSMGKKSENGVSACAYRGVGGNKCAAGIFIPDELYSDKLEGVGIRYIMDNSYGPPPLYNENIAKVMPLDADTMSKLQQMHDSYSHTEHDPRPAMIQFVNAIED